ncbi:Cof-type HAD-IIB family hydrolase [Corynebacterium sp. TA-R-1]|uniref:Cof-type HAD-IIB family hydrolase n=1 Tax=Corynebacterium stercoris TaxID=2943490 RepID=A0ABT1G0X7_9CORY|nr:Cof-type HAD-IIB family hydrolase [Corynebacterium stercoris]
MTSPKLVALDMDGTLLTPTGTVPESFWQVLADARSAGLVVAPASGRQLATLRSMFERDEPDTFIAENGAAVWHKGEIVSTTPMDEAPVARLVAALEDAPFTAYVVVCAPSVCYTRDDLPAEIDEEIAKYYHSRETFASLTEAPLNDVIKIALYVASDAEADALPWVESLVPELRALVSSKHWLDIMHPEADKGVALLSLADALSIDHQATAAIGDYLNDYGMLNAAGYAVAMGNAHDDLKAIADEVVGTNADEAAVEKLKAWL